MPWWRWRRVGLDRGDHQVGVDPVGDEGLGAVDDVVVAVAAGRWCVIDARSEPMPGLGHGDGGDQLAGDDAGQPALLLLLGAVGEEVGQADVVVQGDAQPGAAASGAQDSSASTALNRKSATPPPPYSSGTSMPRKPGRPAVVNSSRGHDPRGVPLVEVRHDLLVQEGADGLPERLVVGVVERAAHAASSYRRPRQPRTPCGRGHHPTGARHLPRRFDHLRCDPMPVEFVRIITGERIPGSAVISPWKKAALSTSCKTDSYGNSCRGTPRRRRHDGGGAADERACDHAAGTTRTALARHRGPPPRRPHGRPRPAAQQGWGIPLVVLIAGMFMSVLDTSIVNVAIPKMQNDFGVDRRRHRVGRHGLHAGAGRGRAGQRWLRRRFGADPALHRVAARLRRRIGAVRAGVEPGTA